MEEQDRILLKKFMDKVWPDYRNNVYRGLYRTYHPSTYSESFSNPMDNMVEAVDEIDVAINKGMSYGLIRKDVSSNFQFRDGPPLEIHEGGNTEQMGWLPATLLFNVLWDIVEEFRCYCGENGIDPDCKGKCMGEFPYLYEDYNNLHDYMKILESEGAPLDILLDEYPQQLNKIQLSPDYPYRPHEHNHNANRLEEVDKFLSRRLSVIKENIYTLSDGDLLGESEQHKLENEMCELFNVQKHEASEQLFRWSIKDIINETKMSDITLKKKQLNESPELNPELEEGDKVIVVNKLDKPTGYRKYFENQEPTLYEKYIVIEKRYSGGGVGNYHYFLLPDKPENQNIELGDSLNLSNDQHKNIRALFPWISEWVHAKDKVIQKENPELEEGDIVRVIEVDGEHDRMPDKWGLYKVMKVGNLHQKQHDYYDLMSLEDSQKNPRRQYSLYRGDTWIKVDEPNQLNEQGNGERYENPELKYGDIVIPIDVDKSDGTMHTPDMYKRYKVISNLSTDSDGEIYYYEIEPVDLSDDDRLSSMLVGGGRRRNERLYPDHDRYKIDKENKITKTPYLDKLDGMEIEIDPNESERGQPFSWVDEETGTVTDTLLFDIDYIRTAPILTYGDTHAGMMGDKPKENELVKFDLIFKGDKSGLFLDWFSLDDVRNRKMLISHFNSIPVKESILNIVYNKYFKLYGIKKQYLRLENVLIPDGNGVVRNVSGGRQLSEEILDTFEVISKFNKGIKVN